MDNNQNQNQVQNVNNVRRFNNPFNLDPAKEDILIGRKLDRDAFCPFFASNPEFGIGNNYYSILHVDPLKESFFHSIQALFFPNATFFQLSIIICYIIIIIFIILLCFGLDESNLHKYFLPIKLSALDKLGSFYPKKIKENPWELYRLLTFHFSHSDLGDTFFNFLGLITFCSTFEMFVKKHIFLLTFFLTGIFVNLSTITLFSEYQRFCGITNDITGIMGAFIMLFIMNWKECLLIFNPLGRIYTVYALSVFIFLFLLLAYTGDFVNIFTYILSLIYGAFIFAAITKPIKVEKWKTIVRIISGITVLTSSAVSLVSFYLK